MVPLVRRYQTIEISIQDDRFQLFIGSHRLLTEGQFICAHSFKPDIKSHLTHHSYIHTKLDRGLTVPARDMSTYRLHREKLGEAPLDVKTLYRIGIVTRPKFGEIIQRPIIAPGPSPGAKHHRDMRIFGFDTLKDVIKPTHIIHIQMLLFFFQIRRIRIGNRAIAIPFEVCQIRILGQELVHHSENEVLDLRIR